MWWLLLLLFYGNERRRSSGPELPVGLTTRPYGYTGRWRSICRDPGSEKMFNDDRKRNSSNRVPGDRPRRFNDLQLWIPIRNATKTYFMRFNLRFFPPGIPGGTKKVVRLFSDLFFIFCQFFDTKCKKKNDVKTKKTTGIKF